MGWIITCGLGQTCRGRGSWEQCGAEGKLARAEAGILQLLSMRTHEGGGGGDRRSQGSQAYLLFQLFLSLHGVLLAHRTPKRHPLSTQTLPCAPKAKLRSSGRCRLRCVGSWSLHSPQWHAQGQVSFGFVEDTGTIHPRFQVFATCRPASLPALPSNPRPLTGVLLEYLKGGSDSNWLEVFSL